MGSVAAEILQGLRDFQVLKRQNALQALKEAVETGTVCPTDLEDPILETLRLEAWEAKHGALLAAAEVIQIHDSPKFRALLVKESKTLFTDSEYRVRKEVGTVLGECCRRDGLSVYDDISVDIFTNIHDTFERAAEDLGAAELGLPPELKDVINAGKSPGKHDTEGWRTLESSMGCLEAMMKGCGEAFTPRIDKELLDLLAECTAHSNRFVREYAFFALKTVYEVCELAAFEAKIAPETVEILRKGIKDNWSQVRYAGSVALRAFMERAPTPKAKAKYFEQLLPNMCLNRHYVAEGVRLYSQETWKRVCGPAGGAGLLMEIFDFVIDAFIEATEAPNHAVREAGNHCICELAMKVAGPAQSPYRCHFTPARVQRLVDALVESFQDESWPVRDVASTALGHFVKVFPEQCEPLVPQLSNLWLEQLGDSIPSMRQNGARALAMAVATYPAMLWEPCLAAVDKDLIAAESQNPDSQSFSEYTPSGPFSVPQQKKSAFGDPDDPDPSVTNQMLYSCGSMAPKTFKRKNRDPGGGGCMNCAVHREQQPWEVSDGAIHLFTELVLLAAGEQPPDTAHLDSLAERLPVIAKVFGLSHYRHHHALKLSVIERLLEIHGGLGPARMVPSQAALLQVAKSCAQQTAHRSLKVKAQDMIAAWAPSSDGPGKFDATAGSGGYASTAAVPVVAKAASSS